MRTPNRNSIGRGHTVVCAVNCNNQRHIIMLLPTGRLQLVGHPDWRSEIESIKALRAISKHATEGGEYIPSRCIEIQDAWYSLGKVGANGKEGLISRATLNKVKYNIDQILPTELRAVATKIRDRRVKRRIAKSPIPEHIPASGKGEKLIRAELGRLRMRFLARLAARADATFPTECPSLVINGYIPANQTCKEMLYVTAEWITSHLRPRNLFHHGFLILKHQQPRPGTDAYMLLYRAAVGWTSQWWLEFENGEGTWLK